VGESEYSAGESKYSVAVQRGRERVQHGREQPGQRAIFRHWHATIVARQPDEVTACAGPFRAGAKPTEFGGGGSGRESEQQSPALSTSAEPVRFIITRRPAACLAIFGWCAPFSFYLW
jgi:hypothetical protein